jgi:23S rRNA-/tRNA-specific pseudouridylate synthase
MIAAHTNEDGSVDFKALSKLVPLRADKGELEVLFEDQNIIVVSKPQVFLNNGVVIQSLSSEMHTTHNCLWWRTHARPFTKSVRAQGMAMNPPHRFLSGTLINRLLGYLGGEKPPHVLHR